MNDEYNLYIIAEIKYIKDHSDIDEEQLFPRKWYYYNDYKLKTKILLKAIESKKRIEEIDEYYELINDVK